MRGFLRAVKGESHPPEPPEGRQLGMNDSIKGTPCEAAVEQALHVARQILSGAVDVFEGGRQIASLGSADCYDFLNEVDVVDQMAGFWLPVGDPEQRRAIGLPPLDNAAERAEEIRRASRNLVDRFGG